MLPIGDTPSADEIAEADPTGLDPVQRLNRDLAQFQNDPNAPLSPARVESGGVDMTARDWFRYEDETKRLVREEEVLKILDRAKEAAAYDLDRTIDVLGQYGIDASSITVAGVPVTAGSGGPGGGAGGWG